MHLEARVDSSTCAQGVFFLSPHKTLKSTQETPENVKTTEFVQTMELQNLRNEFLNRKFRRFFVIGTPLTF